MADNRRVVRCPPTAIQIQNNVARKPPTTKCCAGDDNVHVSMCNGPSILPSATRGQTDWRPNGPRLYYWLDVHMTLGPHAHNQNAQRTETRGTHAYARGQR
eukprot:5941132-Lingulodinium_polyedra.AAC.1